MEGHETMNRRQQGAAHANAKGATVDPVVAVHEAGHALARYLTAEMMGLSEEQSVSSIVVHAAQEVPGGISLDGGAVKSAQATTYGPVFSSEIDAARRDMEIAKGWSNLPAEELAANWGAFENLEELIETAREQGCDVEKWLRARAVIAVGGAVAESAYRGVALSDVLEGVGAGDDMMGLIRDIKLLGLSDDEIAAIVNEAAAWFADKIARDPSVLDALNALGNRIHKPGTMPGRAVVGIIRHAMGVA